MLTGRPGILPAATARALSAARCRRFRRSLWHSPRLRLPLQFQSAGALRPTDGYGIRNALITLTAPDGSPRTVRTSSFGYYRFDEVEAGQTYILNIRSKQFVFNPNTRVVSVLEDLTDVDWTAEVPEQ